MKIEHKIKQYVSIDGPKGEWNKALKYLKKNGFEEDTHLFDSDTGEFWILGVKTITHIKD